jgi:hypothetical protein
MFLWRGIGMKGSFFAQSCYFSMPRICLGHAKRYQSMMLEVNKRVYLEGRSPYLKTHCDKAAYYFSKITDPACVG